MLNEDEITLLFEHAARRAGLLVGRRLGHGNEVYIPQMARDAAVRVLMTPAGPAREALIRKGEAAFRLLGEEMVHAAERMPGYPRDIVGEGTRDDALIALGPWPPFW